jgi:hypothetical protein
MNPLLLIKVLDLTMLAVTAGMTYMEARAKNRPTIEAIERLKSQALLGEVDEAEFATQVDELVRVATSARKAAKAAAPVPEGYSRSIL